MADDSEKAGAEAPLPAPSSAPKSEGEALEGAEGTEGSAAPASTANLLDEAASGDDDEADAEHQPNATEERKEKKATGTVVHLRGKLKMQDDETVLYTGVWASAKEDFADKTKTSKIRYETSMTEEQLRKGDLNETSWDGYFLVNEGTNAEGKVRYRKIKEEGIELTAEVGASGDLFNIAGNGVNEFGAFAVKGVFNKATRQLMMVKQYEAEDDDDEMEEDTRTAEEVADELALLREDAALDIAALKSGEHLKKRKASGGAAAAPLPMAKRERRQSAMRAQSQWRDKINAQNAGGAGDGGGNGDELQSMTDQLKTLRKAGGGVEKLMPLLRKLGKFPMTVAHLTRTKVGSVVNKLAKKHDDVDVKRAAGGLVKQWREAAAKEAKNS